MRRISTTIAVIGIDKGFRGIRHYSSFGSGNRTANIARARELLGAAPTRR